MSKPLSPAAQAVLSAFLDTPGEEPMAGWQYGRDLAAALRAAADQVVPVTSARAAAAAGKRRARADLLSIAAELEALP